MKRQFFFLGVVFFGLSFLTSPVKSCQPEAQESLTQGQAAYRNRTDLSQAQTALSLFEKAITSDPACEEAFIQGSKAAWWVAEHSPTRDEKQKIFQKGIDLAKAAIQLNPRSAPARFWLAGNYGSYGEARGVLKSLFLVKPIRHELNEILKIDPAYDHGAAQRVLGVVDYKVPGVAGGSKTRALENLNKALAFGPNDAFNNYYVAEYYFTVGKKDLSNDYLTILKNLTADEDNRPELLLMQEKGRALEARLKG